jgi:hypothetical protein
VYLAAQENKLDPMNLAANTGRPAAEGSRKVAFVSSSDDEFGNMLAKSIARLAGVSEDAAKKNATESMATIKENPQK